MPNVETPTKKARTSRLSTTPIEFRDGERYPMDRRRLRRKPAPSGVCEDCWHYRRSDDKRGEMWIGEKWIRPQVLCAECVEYRSTPRHGMKGDMLRRWPLGIVRETRKPNNTARQRGLCSTTLTAGTQVLIATTVEGDCPFELRMDPKFFDGELRDEALQMCRTLLDRVDPVNGERRTLELLPDEDA